MRRGEFWNGIIIYSHKYIFSWSLYFKQFLTEFFARLFILWRHFSLPLIFTLSLNLFPVFLFIQHPCRLFFQFSSFLLTFVIHLFLFVLSLLFYEVTAFNIKLTFPFARSWSLFLHCFPFSSSLIFSPLFSSFFQPLLLITLFSFCVIFPSQIIKYFELFTNLTLHNFSSLFSLLYQIFIIASSSPLFFNSFLGIFYYNSKYFCDIWTFFFLILLWSKNCWQFFFS